MLARFQAAREGEFTQLFVVALPAKLQVLTDIFLSISCNAAATPLQSFSPGGEKTFQVESCESPQVRQCKQLQISNPLRSVKYLCLNRNKEGLVCYQARFV